MNLDVDHIYICHWDKLKERKQFLINHLRKNDINNYEWVEIYDKDNLNKEQIRKEYPLIFELTPIAHRLLRTSEISLLLKHCWIIKNANQNQYSSILVLEDDVILANNFIQQFNQYKLQLPQEWDICWVGSCFDLHAKHQPHTHVYKTNSSRCTHAFIVSSHGIKKLITQLHTANEAADWFYNLLIERLNLNNFWFEPSLASQGSQNGQYQSMVQN